MHTFTPKELLVVMSLFLEKRKQPFILQGRWGFSIGQV